MFSILNKRFFCAKNVPKSKPIPLMRKAVIVSTSHDIFSNLALENWIFKNETFADKHLLMLWSNNPCVVIGRHQNPWQETNISNLKVDLARRHSGGGTVYHDRGNLNLTFFTPNEHYNRRYNLEFIALTLKNEYGMHVEISPREDLTLQNCKISGTAAKLARKNAYHHCTLLINSDLKKLRQSLSPPKWEIETNATKSIKSTIANLSEQQPSLTVDESLKLFAKSYLQKHNLNLKSGSFNLEQSHVKQIDYNDLKIQFVTPDEQLFPGINNLRNELIDWNWIYGKTPKFNVRRNLNDSIQVNLCIVKGIIETFDVNLPENNSELRIKLESIKGLRYSEEILNELDPYVESVVSKLTHQAGV